MPSYATDKATTVLIARLAGLRGASKRNAAETPGQAEERVPLRDRFAALRAAHPLPPRTGRAADKAFFDELSGGL